MIEEEKQDLLDFYLAELAQQTLLTHEEEVELARQIETGRQAEQALEETDYTADEFARLESLAEAGQAARAQLGQANTRLVVSIAKRYRGLGIPFIDLIQNGNVGLMRAVDHYDHRKGYRFSTYATWWIRQAVTRSLSNHGRVIRIPVHTGARIRKMTRVVQCLEMEQGARPTPEEIAAEMGEAPEKVRQMMGWAGDVLSLEKPLGQDGELQLYDLIEDEQVLHPDELTDVRLLREVLGSLIADLSVREAQILRLRYGFGGTQPHTLAEVGKKFNLSRERIRQIEREALVKLRLAAFDLHLDHFL